MIRKKFIKSKQNIVILFFIGLILLNSLIVSADSKKIGNKAVIQLSIRNRYEDIFWFTFFHECGHILKHGRKREFIDLDGNSSSAEEMEANAFAAEMLLPEKTYSKFCQHKKFIKASVRRFAQEQGISPAVVVGRLQHDSLLPPTHLNDLRRKLDWAG